MAKETTTCCVCCHCCVYIRVQQQYSCWRAYRSMVSCSVREVLKEISLACSMFSILIRPRAAFRHPFAGRSAVTTVTVTNQSIKRWVTSVVSYACLYGEGASKHGRLRCSSCLRNGSIYTGEVIIGLSTSPAITHVSFHMPMHSSTGFRLSEKPVTCGSAELDAH